MPIPSMPADLPYAETAVPVSPDPRPAMTRREASWHQAVAGIRAARAAEAAGAAPEARHALALAAAAEAGILPQVPVYLGTLWALEASEPFTDSLTAGAHWADMALEVFTLREPERVLLAALAGDTADIMAGMIETAAAVDIPTARAIRRGFAQQMALLKALTGGADIATPEGKRD